MDIPDHALVALIMGSDSDRATMAYAHKALQELGIKHDIEVISAHRAPELMAHYAKGAPGLGIEIIIAGAGGAAHLPGMVASYNDLPVIGVPIDDKAATNMADMPAGVPLATMSVGKAGATNAAYLAARILGNKYPAIRERLQARRISNAQKVDTIKPAD